MDKKKDGPPYKEIAGKEEDHEPLKTKDAPAVKNVVEWILSR